MIVVLLILIFLALLFPGGIRLLFVTLFVLFLFALASVDQDDATKNAPRTGETR